MNLKDLELSLRARNVLARARIETASELATAEFSTLVNTSSCGLTTLRELLRHLIRNGVRPRWLGQFNNRATTHGVHPRGYVKLAGPFAHSERVALEMCVALLDEYAVTYNDAWWVWVPGAKFNDLGDEQ